MRRWIVAALLLLCLPMVGEGQSIRYYPDGATMLTIGEPQATSIRYYLAQLRNGLVAFWNMDESSDGSVAVTRYDLSGLFPLSDVGATKAPSATGVLGNAVRGANGVQQYLKNTSFDLQGKPGATIAFWARWHTSVTGNWAVGITNDGACAHQQFTVNARVSDKACYAYVGATVYSITAANCVPNDTTTWTHIVVVYNGTAAAGERVAIYKNGSVLGVTPTGGTLPTTLPSVLTPSLLVVKACGNNYGNVDYDMVGVWNRALTPSEAALLFANNGVP